MKISKKYFSYSTSLFACVAIVLIFQNCGDVNILNNPTLSAPELPPEVVGSSDSFTQLPSGASVEIHHRLVLTIDMSGSMIQLPCPGDLDTNSPVARPGPNCVDVNGLDVQAYRFAIARKIIQQVQDRPRLKIMIAPFTGPTGILKLIDGRSDSPINEHAFKFLTPSQALTLIGDLEDVQNQNISQIGEEMIDNKMTTSNPGPAIIKAYDMLRLDMDNQANAGVLANTKYELVFLSDGKVTPSIRHTAVALATIFQALQSCCQNPAEDFVEFLIGRKPITELGRDCPGFLIGGNQGIGTVCYTTVPGDQTWNFGVLDLFRLSFGDPLNNRIEIVNAYIAALKGLPLIQGGAEVNLTLYGLGVPFLRTEDPSSLLPQANWIQGAFQRFPTDRYREPLNDEMNELFFDTYPDLESYSLKHSWLFNLNARTDSFGNLKVDSDADGLFDDEDPNPTVARSNGICLDQITEQRGCRTINCKADLDIDSDGLNECEEISVGTSPTDFDTDGDGIPDAIEVIWGLNSKKYDSVIDDNRDGISNYQNLQMGLHADLIPALVPANKKISFQVRENPDRQYALRIGSVPLLPTQESTGNIPLKPARQSTQVIEERFNLLGSDHTAGTNQLYVLMALEGNLTYNKKWFIKKINTRPGVPSLQFQAQDLEIISVKDPL